jgi:hypothetical protein
MEKERKLILDLLASVSHKADRSARNMAGGVSNEADESLPADLSPLQQVRDLFHTMPCGGLTVGGDLTKQGQCALRDANQIVETLIV